LPEKFRRKGNQVKQGSSFQRSKFKSFIEKRLEKFEKELARLNAADHIYRRQWSLPSPMGKPPDDFRADGSYRSTTSR